MRWCRLKWTLCLLMALLLVLMMSLPSGAAVRYVPMGWASPEPGYWLAEHDGRDLLAAVRTYRQEAAEWEWAAREMEMTVQEFQADADQRLAELEAQFNAERRAWRAEQRKAWLYVALAGGIGYLIGR